MKLRNPFHSPISLLRNDGILVVREKEKKKPKNQGVYEDRTWARKLISTVQNDTC